MPATPLSHRAIFKHSIPQTYYSEVWSNMDDWCTANCEGGFRLDAPNDVRFELKSDLEKFTTKWFSTEHDITWEATQHEIRI